LKTLPAKDAVKFFPEMPQRKSPSGKFRYFYGELVLKLGFLNNSIKKMLPKLEKYEHIIYKAMAWDKEG
jgi:hypothetical protein